MKTYYLLSVLFVIFTPIFAVAQESEILKEDEPILTYLRPFRTISISPPKRGEIAQIHVTRGQKVSKDDLLIELDSAMEQARFAIAKAQAAGTGAIKAAEADEKLNRDRFAVVSKLRSRGTANSAEFERQKAQLQMSQANTLAAKEQLEIAALQVKGIEVELEQHRLRSPIDGIVVEIFAEVGETVSTTQPELIQIVEIDKLRAKAFVPFAKAVNLSKGDKVKIRVQDEAKTEVEGKIEFKSPIADPAAGTVEIVAVVRNEKATLPIGVSGEFVIQSD